MPHLKTGGGKEKCYLTLVLAAMLRFRCCVDHLWIVFFVCFGFFCFFGLFLREAGTGILTGNFPGLPMETYKQERAKSAGERREARKAFAEEVM